MLGKSLETLLHKIKQVEFEKEQWNKAYHQLVHYTFADDNKFCLISTTTHPIYLPLTERDIDIFKTMFKQSERKCYKELRKLRLQLVDHSKLLSVQLEE